MKKVSLSLHHLTAMDVGARELVSLAAQAGCKDVCLFTYMPAAFRHKYPLISKPDVELLAAHMKQQLIGCLSLEAFPLTVEADFPGMEEGLAIGSELGARFATVHSHLDDINQARDALGRLSIIALKYGIRLGIEFNPFSKLTTLQQAMELIEPLGSPTIGLTLDTLHAVRSGASLTDIAAAQDRLSLIQISDGPSSISQAEKWVEAIGSRMVPGEGEFPLVEMLANIHSDLFVSVEVPQSAAASPLERVHCAVTGARKTLEAAGFTAV